MKLKSVSTQEVLSLLETPNIQIIDIRDVNLYNGWPELKAPRGGHIPGARSVSIKWHSYIDWIEILRKKEIVPENKIILYGGSSAEMEMVAKTFLKAEYPDVSLYTTFQAEWINDSQYPLVKLTRFDKLVSPGWLQTAIMGKQPKHLEGNQLVVCHCHYRNHDDYLEGHIPGAISLDSLLLESPETWNRRNPEELQKNLEDLGIHSNSTVVVYGRFSFPDNDDPFPGSSAGHLGAIRCAFIMLYAGVKDVKILNGGLQSWQDAGFEITSENAKLRTIEDFGVSIPQRPELAVDLDDAQQMLKSQQADLISVRSWPEFIGEVSGYNYIEKTGRIPGAIFGNCGSDAYHMENYRNLDHTMLEANDIIKQWEEAGIEENKHNAFYCGTGWRGSEAFFNAWLMGWPKVSVFDGGWFEWSNANLPFETGEPK